VDVIYEIELTDMQFYDLNDFFNNYSPPTQKALSYNSNTIMQLSQHNPNSVDYTLCGTCNFLLNFSLDDDSVLEASFISSCTSDYQVRIYNLTTNSVLGESAVLNNTTAHINMINCSIPNLLSVIELHVKSKSTVNLQSAQLNLYT
jgi:hypothetical protein